MKTAPRFAAAAAGLVMLAGTASAQYSSRALRPPADIPVSGEPQIHRDPVITREELPPVRKQLNAKTAEPCPEDLRSRYCIPKPEIVSKPDIVEGQIIISDDEKFLYLGIGNYMMVGPAQAVRYKIATAQAHEKMPRGDYFLSTRLGARNAEGKQTGMSKNPQWCPTDNIALQRGMRPGRCVPGNDRKNPFGGVAFYIAYNNEKGVEVQTLFRIHGTIQPEKIGQDASAGCTRMYSPDALDLYARLEGMLARGVAIKIHNPQGPTREEYARTQREITADIQARYGYREERYYEPRPVYRRCRGNNPFEQFFCQF